MSASVDGYSNNAYEYVFLARTGTRSQGNINDLELDHRRERFIHGRSVDQYVEMNTVFHIPFDDDDVSHNKELHRGKSEDLDCRKPKTEPVAITGVYENMTVKQQNPRRKLRRNTDAYEEYSFGRQEEKNSRLSGKTFVSNAFIMVKDDYREDNKGDCTNVMTMPLSPTHYNQPPTPDHPPPSALHAENLILDKIRPLSQVGL